MQIVNRPIGDGHPCYIIAEVGINHNGDLEIAKRLIEEASKAGADAVKFQKRTIPDAIPAAMRFPHVTRQTPWGTLSYVDYKHKLEFGRENYKELRRVADRVGVHFGVSVWDMGALEFAQDIGVFHFLKVPSALMSNEQLVRAVNESHFPFFWSTGMHSMGEVSKTARWIDENYNWGVLQCNSTYPADPAELDLKVIPEWKRLLPFKNRPVGYSGHETGLAPTVAAVALGSNVVERHITLDRSMWGSDQAASVEPQGFARLVRDIRTVETALGDGNKKFYQSEAIKREQLTP